MAKDYNGVTLQSQRALIEYHLRIGGRAFDFQHGWKNRSLLLTPVRGSQPFAETADRTRRGHLMGYSDLIGSQLNPADFAGPKLIRLPGKRKPVPGERRNMVRWNYLCHSGYRMIPRDRRQPK